MSRVSARHRKPSQSPARTSTPIRHRKLSPITSALRRPAWAAVTVAGLALIVAAGLAAPHLLGGSLRPAAMDDASGFHSHRASAQSSQHAGGGPVSNTTAGFSRLRTHKRHTHSTAQPQAPAQAPSAQAPSAVTANGPVTQGTGCVASPHSCGFPDATNTGANCSQLTPSGSVTITGNGAVVEGKNISGSITVQASNVVIRNDCVTSSDIYPVHFVSGSNLTVEDTTITGTGHGCDRAVESAGGSTVMDALNVSGCEDGIQMHDNDVLENSYIHDLAFTSSSHNDGVQQNGGHNDVVKHNTIFNPHNQTSCVNFTTDFGGISNITITGNLLNGGNYTVYSRSGGNGDPTGVTVTDNHFGSADVFGLLSNDGSVTWSGNVSDATGQPIGD